jgi:acid phosphatase
MKQPVRVLAGVAIVSCALAACSDGVQTGTSWSGTQLLAAHTQSFDPAAGGDVLQGADQVEDRIAAAARRDAAAVRDRFAELRARLALERISNVVVIYAENRAFDHLYGNFPGANGLQQALAAGSYRQVDLDGSVLPVLPPVWGGLTPAGAVPAIPQSETAGLPNAPFAIDSRFGLPSSVRTRDLDHSFFFNQMQIDGGRNDRFAAASDAGALVMGHYDGSSLPMWQRAREYTLADNFFMGAFGGSFLNHFWLVCACTPVFPGADTSASKGRIAAPGAPDGVSLLLDPGKNVRSVLDANGRPPYVGNGAITPINQRFDQFYAVNTMQPPYQPSGNAPPPQGDPALADPRLPGTLPPQDAPTIGDLLSSAGVTWAWYAGGWNAALADRANIYNNSVPNFQAHHQPFNYFRSFAPGSAARAQHLRDGGELPAAIDSGNLPQVVFYKPQGSLNEHPGYTDVASGDAHIAQVVDRLRASPQWKNMLIIVTYDENGGFWDHVAPPKGDRFGPSNRVPTILISPFVKKGHVDHTQYDTTSVLRLITRKFHLPKLAGLAERDRAMEAQGQHPMGDLTASLRPTRQ